MTKKGTGKTRKVEVPAIAVVGSGYWGKNLVRNYGELGALRLICDNNEITVNQFKTKYPDIEVCLAFNDVLGRDTIQAVVIATPAETHFALAREALMAGKHVYVEKPLVLDEAEGQELIEIAGRRNLVLMVGHLLQYHPVFVKLKELGSERRGRSCFFAFLRRGSEGGSEKSAGGRKTVLLR